MQYAVTTAVQYAIRIIAANLLNYVCKLQLVNFSIIPYCKFQPLYIVLLTQKPTTSRAKKGYFYIANYKPLQLPRMRGAIPTYTSQYVSVPTNASCLRLNHKTVRLELTAVHCCPYATNQQLLSQQLSTAVHMPQTSSCSANQYMKFYPRTHSSAIQIVTEPDEPNPHSHRVLPFFPGGTVAGTWRWQLNCINRQGWVEPYLRSLHTPWHGQKL